MKIIFSRTQNGLDKNYHSKEIVVEPSPIKTVVEKVIASCICACIFMRFITVYPIKTIKGLWITRRLRVILHNVLTPFVYFVFICRRSLYQFGILLSLLVHDDVNNCYPFQILSCLVVGGCHLQQFRTWFQWIRC